jgi:hypothetical protein
MSGVRDGLVKYVLRAKIVDVGLSGVKLMPKIVQVDPACKYIFKPVDGFDQPPRTRDFDPHPRR